MEIITENISADWLKLILKKKKDTLGLQNIYTQVAANCTPPPDLWFEWARLIPLDKIKVVIIGQDPYPTRGTAHGLAFSSLNTYPDSLRNVYKCLERGKLISDHRQTTACLVSWAQQGVLLLNTALSTEIGKRRAHFDLWEEYMKRILVRILQYHIDSDLVLMCWGRDAQKLIASILTKSSHKFQILEWCHPSPMTGDRFLDCDHFTKANDILQKLGKTPIDWATISTAKNATATKVEAATKWVAATKVVAKIECANQVKQVIFTDGSALSTGNKKGGNKKDAACIGGYAASFVAGPIRGSLLGNLDTSQHFASNIRAEGWAFISALDKCHKELKEPTQIEIYSDSEFWIKMLQVYMPHWTDKKFTEKENSDMTLRLWHLYEKVKTKHQISLHHVYSHNKSGLKESTKPEDKWKYENNESVDHMATEARLRLKPGQEIWRPFPN